MDPSHPQDKEVKKTVEGPADHGSRLRHFFHRLQPVEPGIKES